MNNNGRHFRDVSLGDSLERILQPKKTPKGRERFNLPDEAPMPPSTPPSVSPPRKKSKKPKKKSLIALDLFLFLTQ